MMLKDTGRLKQDALFFGILAFVIVLRCLILVDFAFNIYDSDQSIMWNGAIDYSHGIFHEPRFYGQAYSTMLEALLAVPLIWLSVPVYIALPVITTVLTLLPFVLIALVARSQGKVLQACLVLAIPIFLPVEYGFLTTLARGFVPGIFVASIGAVMLYYPDRKWGWFIFGLCSMLGYSVNSNSFLISAPVFLYLWLNNLKTSRFYFYCGAGFLIGLAVHLLVALFYILHPDHAIHHLARFMMAISLFLDAFKHLDRHLGFVTPVFGTHGIMSLILFILIGTIFLFQKKRNAAIMAFASLGLILVSLSLKQVFMSTDSIFYSYARYYLALPVLIALFIPFLGIPFKRIWIVVMILTTGLFIARVQDIEPAYTRVLAPGINHYISIATPEIFRKKCQQIGYFAKLLNISLVVVENDYFYDFIDYGCATCFEKFPATLRPVYERRVWRLKEEQTSVHRNIMIVDFGFRMGRELKKLDQTGVTYFNVQGFYFILGNKKPTLELLKTLDIEIRPF